MIDMDLLKELKNYLDITWDNEDTDSKLTGILGRAESTLNAYAGYEISFSEQPDSKQLLFDCCRYIYNNALEDFKINFQQELIMLRANQAVKDIEKEVSDI